MPGAIGWAPALLPSRGGVIARPRFNPGTPALRAAIGRSRKVEDAALLPVTPTLRSGKLNRPVKYRFPTFEYFGHTGYRRRRLPYVSPPCALLVLWAYHSRGFSNSFSCLGASASSGLTGLSQRGSVLCSARIIAGVTGSGAQPWSVSHTRSHCGAAVR